MRLCPIMRLTVSIGTPIDKVMCVPKLCLAMWKVIGYARRREQVKIKRKSFEMSKVSAFCQMVKMQKTTEY